MTTLIAAALIPYALALTLAPALRTGDPSRLAQLSSALFFGSFAALGWTAVIVLAHNGAEALLVAAVALTSTFYAAAVASFTLRAVRSANATTRIRPSDA